MIESWRRLLDSRFGAVGLVLVVAVIALALFGPLLAPADPQALGPDSLALPSGAHPMGTDDLGRDVFSRFVYGARVSLVVGVSAALMSALLGTAVGACAGFFGGFVDQVSMRVAEFFQIIPRFFLAILVISFFGSGIAFVILVIGFLGWPEIARLARAEFLKLRGRDYVAAARANGSGPFSIMIREVLPNAASPLVVVSSLHVSSAILIEASLSFLGLADPARPSWGLMLNDAQQFMKQAWWLAVFPGAGIFVTVAGFNLLGDGLNHMLRPQRSTAA